MASEYKKGISRRTLLKGASATAIGASATSLLAAPAIAQASNTIRILTVEDPFFFALRGVLPEFEAETGIKVEMESLSYGGLQARLISSFVAGNPDADLISVDNIWNGQMMDNGWLQPVDEFIAGDDIDFEDFMPEVIYSFNAWRGKIASLPVATYAQGVMYRPDIFDALGIEAPPAVGDDLSAWTWEAYIERLQQINGQSFDGQTIAGSVVSGQQPAPVVHMFTQIAASHGMKWFKNFPQAPWDFEPLMNSPENMKAANLFKQIYDLSPPESLNYNWFDAGTRFSKGDIGMFFWWTPYFYLIRNDGYMSGVPSAIKEKYATAPLPVASDGTKQTVSLGGWSLGMPANSANQDQAWQFMRWATSAATQKKMGLYNEFGYQFSDFGRRSLYDDPELKEVYPYLDDQLVMFQQGDGKFSRPPSPIYTTLEGIYGLQLSKILSGQSSVEDSLEETNVLFENVLKGNFLIPYERDSYDDTLEGTKELMAKLAGG